MWMDYIIIIMKQSNDLEHIPWLAGLRNNKDIRGGVWQDRAEDQATTTRQQCNYLIQQRQDNLIRSLMLDKAHKPTNATVQFKSE